jgi:transcriptional regulator with XRE-family HTH domain
MNDESTGQAVRRLREAQGLSQAELARRSGVYPNTIRQIEDDSTKRSRFLPEVARALGVSLIDIHVSDRQRSVSKNNDVTAIRVSEPPLFGGSNIPVFGVLESGGGLVMSPAAVQLVPRPSPLDTVQDAFGVIVPNEDVSPVLRPGDTALIHPHLPPRPDDIALFESVRDGTRHVLLRQFVASTPEGWKVRVLFPTVREETLKKADWPRVMAVVASFYRR